MGPDVLSKLVKPLLKILKYKSSDEERFAHQLNLMKFNGQIKDWGYEWITFKLADGSRYTPDFIVIKDDCIECYEVKGFLREAARVRFLIAAEKFPYFRWKMIRYDHKDKTWKIIMEK